MDQQDLNEGNEALEDLRSHEYTQHFMVMFPLFQKAAPTAYLLQLNGKYFYSGSVCAVT